MGDEMKQAETGMPSLTLEPELVMEQEKEPEVQAQLMEVTQEMNPVQQKMAQTVLTPEEQQMVENFAGKIDLENLTQVMQAGEIFESLNQMFDMNFIIPKHSQFGTVIGAALAGCV